MDHKIINASRYKTISKSKKNKLNKLKNSNKYTAPIISNNKIDSKKSTSKKHIKKSSTSIKSKIIKVAICILILFLIMNTSNIITTIENVPFLSVFTSTDSNLKPDYVLNVGIKNLDTSNNVLVNELSNYSYEYLLSINEDYTIDYNLLERIDKVDSKVYNLVIKEEVYTDDIKASLETNKDKLGIYEIKKTNEINIMITLNDSDPYFVYELASIKLLSKNNENLYRLTTAIDEANFIKEEYTTKPIISEINISNYSSSTQLVEDFKKGYIEMFLTSSEEEINLLGKYDYNVKKYRDGESYFLMFNSDSEILDNLDLRRAFTYSINKSEIVNEISRNFAEVIDLPYIYSDIVYRYDNIAAENILIENGYIKDGGIYTKDSEPLIIKLLVNKDDTQKVLIAEEIKFQVEKVGIRVDLLKMTNEEIENLVNTNGDYDAVISTVTMSQSADISYLYEYININETIDEAILNVENSSVEELASNINNLKQVMIDEIACFGILAKNVSVITKKDIVGIEEISYMNIFENIENIGKNK